LDDGDDPIGQLFIPLAKRYHTVDKMTNFENSIYARRYKCRNVTFQSIQNGVP